MSAPYIRLRPLPPVKRCGHVDERGNKCAAPMNQTGFCPMHARGK